VTWIVQPT
jgi:DNA-binding NarL/FixJ family response regulator